MLNLGSISEDHVTLANDVTLANANADVGSQWNASSQGSLAKFYVPRALCLKSSHVVMQRDSFDSTIQ